MIRDRDADRSTDVGAIWFGHGVDLAERLQAHIDLWREQPVADPATMLDDLEELLHAEHDPRPHRRPQLGDPPTLRSAIPPAEPRRAAEPGS